MTLHRAQLISAGRATASALRLPPRHLMTAAHALLITFVVEMLIRRVRLARLADLLGVRVDLRPSTCHEPLLLDALPVSAQRQLHMTWKVSRAWPLSDGPCLRRALVAGHLVRRLDPTIRLGFTDDAAFRAHAWLEIDGRPLENVESYHRFELAHDDAIR